MTGCVLMGLAMFRKSVRRLKPAQPVLALAGVFAAVCAFGDTMSSWNGGTGNWGTATNWTPVAVPNNSGSTAYDVTIGSGGTDTVNLDPGLSPTVNALTVGGSQGTSDLRFGGGNVLTVVNGMTVNATGAVDLAIAPQGSLSVGGTLTNAGAITSQTGSLAAGNLINSGQMSMFNPSGRSTFSVPGTLTNNGFLELGDAVLGPPGPTTNIGRLINNGVLMIGGGEITTSIGLIDVPAGSYVGLGTVAANSILANLTSIEGTLNSYLSVQPVTITPGGPTNTLTIAPSAQVSFSDGANWTIMGNLSVSSPIVFTSDLRYQGPNVINVRGTLSNAVDIALGNSPANLGGQPLADLVVGTGPATARYTQYSDGTLNELIFGPSSNGIITVNGPVSLAGTLEIMLEDGFTPTPGESFTILTFTPGELTGAFDRLLGDSLFNVSYNEAAGTVTITAEAVPEPGTLLMTGCVLMGLVVFRRSVHRLKPAPPV